VLVARRFPNRTQSAGHLRFAWIVAESLIVAQVKLRNGNVAMTDRRIAIRRLAVGQLTLRHVVLQMDRRK
jgi:hypothetical protein